MASTADCRVASFSRLLKQLTQLQPSQYLPEAKHSQYLTRGNDAACQPSCSATARVGWEQKKLLLAYSSACLFS